jgi:hypothetical protein
VDRRDFFDQTDHEVELCVVGGGMAGLCAALAAARHGARVLLMQDRPVLGGNASSEVRMWICGARGPDNKETGILEELMLENYYRNPALRYPIWDTVLYGAAIAEPNLTLLLNCSCTEVRTSADGARIESIRGWQLTTQMWHTIRANCFADCSGDSVLRLSGAEYRWGREARTEFDESHAPKVADRKTMGSSILIQLREVDEHVPFIPPAWANKYHDGDLPNRQLQPEGHNFWWLEVGGTGDTIAGTEKHRDELLKIAFGVWDYIKNHPDGRGHRWELEWIGALPGKRENVRYVGDYTLTQRDIESGGHFEDIIAYGGWPMDDHHPSAIHHPGEPTVFHRAPSPYGIPYRCLYSRNIENLFFAGRNVSVTHMGLSSTRVMATCALLGQAVGTAAAIAVRDGLTPRQVYQRRLEELQTTLMDDDCWLPWCSRPVAHLSLEARLLVTAGDGEPLRNGMDRSLQGCDNGWWARPGDAAAYLFDGTRRVTSVRLVFDSDLHSNKRMPCSYPLKGRRVGVPRRMPRAFNLEALDGEGQWRVVYRSDDEHRRLVKVALDIETMSVRYVQGDTWGAERAHVMSYEVR